MTAKLLVPFIVVVLAIVLVWIIIKLFIIDKKDELITKSLTQKAMEKMIRKLKEDNHYELWNKLNICRDYLITVNEKLLDGINNPDITGIVERFRTRDKLGTIQSFIQKMIGLIEIERRVDNVDDIIQLVDLVMKLAEGCLVSVSYSANIPQIEENIGLIDEGIDNVIRIFDAFITEIIADKNYSIHADVRKIAKWHESVNRRIRNN